MGTRFMLSRYCVYVYCPLGVLEGGRGRREGGKEKPLRIGLDAGLSAQFSVT